MGNKYSICNSCRTLNFSKKDRCALCEIFWKIFNSNNLLLNVYTNDTNKELFLENDIPFDGVTYKYTPKEVLYLYRYGDSGSYWYLDGIGLKNVIFVDIGTPLKKNLNSTHLAVPNGIFFIVGFIKRSRERKSGDKYLEGGGRQFYIPKPVVDALLPYSEKFLSSSMSVADLEIFTFDCKMALLMQEVWWHEYENSSHKWIDRLSAIVKVN